MQFNVDRMLDGMRRIRLFNVHHGRVEPGNRVAQLIVVQRGALSSQFHVLPTDEVGHILPTIFTSCPNRRDQPMSSAKKCTCLWKERDKKQSGSACTNGGYLPFRLV